MKGQSSSVHKKYVIGIAAMEAKSRSKPMRNIIQRLLESEEFEAIIFGDKVILDEDFHTWPTCDFLIAFFSTGFPLQKCIDYVNLRSPYCVNDLIMQKLLFDRRLVLLMLDAIGVPTAGRVIVSRDGGPKLPDDLRRHLKNLKISLNIGPANTFSTVEHIDDDTISVGGKLMRKPFVEKPVDGEDHNIWIYYPKSEGGGCRKLFRKVANKASEFDPEITFVRTEGSYVYEEFMSVDNSEDVKVYTVGPEYVHAETRKAPTVDGIVKRNADGKEMRYVTPLSQDEIEHARKISSSFMQTVCGLDLLRVNGKSFVIDVNGWSFVKGNQTYYDMCALHLRKYFLAAARKKRMSWSLPRETSFENQWRLKSYISVLRHADRTPKQKMKFTATSQPFINLMEGSTEELILKKPEELKLVAVAADEAKKEGCEDSEKMEQLKIVMEKKSKYPGTKVQMKPFFSKTDGMLDRLQIVVKWGGEFTHAGVYHSKDLGENLRKDLMIINKDVFGDVKIYASSERRVIQTAEVFTKALLDIPTIPKDFINIRKDMLDDSYDAKEPMEVVKRRLQDLLNPKGEHVLPEGYSIPKEIGDPALFMQEMVDLLQSRRVIMKRKFDQTDVESIQPKWCCSESPQLFKERWDRLFKEFCDVERDQFDPSKVPELYDSLKYDALHNRDFIEAVFVDENDKPDPKAPLRDLHLKSKQLFDFIAPREYGVVVDEKLEIGILTSFLLLKQVIDDLEEARNSSDPNVRIYFTKESHVHTLYNVIRIILAPQAVEVTELDYLTQITFEVYERGRGLLHDAMPMEYSVRLAFSPGAHGPGLIDTLMDHRHALAVAPRKWITDHINLDDVLKMLKPLLEKKPEPSPKCAPKLQLRK